MVDLTRQNILKYTDCVFEEMVDHTVVLSSGDSNSGSKNDASFYCLTCVKYTESRRWCQ